MVRRPPRTTRSDTPFPYPPLVRSPPPMGRRRTSRKPQSQTKGDDMRSNLKLLAAATLVTGLVAAPALYAQDEPAAAQGPMTGQGMMGQGDRKSTRLNSSH